MPTLSKIKEEIRDFSKWFKIVFIVLALVYIVLWFFTIYLHDGQKERGYEPLLPGAPKDSQEYVLLSESLINGNGLSMNGMIETLRSPGYPIFTATIKTIGGSYFTVTLVQIILVFASAFIIRRIGIVFSGKKVGEIAAALLLVNPVTMTLSLLILTDVLFLFLFSLGFYLVITTDNKKPFLKICLASAFFAYAIYVRSMGIYVAPIFLAPILATKLPFRMQAKLMGVMFLFLIISIAPWVLRNYLVVGVPGFNSLQSVGLSWTVPKFLSNLKGTTEDQESLIFQKITGVPSEAWENRGSYDIRYSKQINQVAQKIILEHPFSYAKFTVITSLPFLFPSSILFMRDSYDSAIDRERPFKPGIINALASGDFQSFYDGIWGVWWKFAERILWLLAYLISLFSIWKDRRNPLVWIFIFITGYLMFFSGPAAGPRLSFQAWPYMFMLFASGGIYAFQAFMSCRNRKKDEYRKPV